MPTRRAILSQLLFAAPPAVEDAGRHTLVCVFLRGGADTMNLVVPYADDSYYRARPTISIKAPENGSSDKSRAVRLDDHYAFHPALRSLHPLFAEGRLAMVQGTGLKDNDTGSHFECQDLMEHGDAAHGVPTGGGWLGRFLRARAEDKLGPLSAVAIGTRLPESLRGAPAVSVMRALEDIAIKTPTGKPELAAKILSELYGADVTLLGEQGRETLKLFERVRELQAADYKPANDAQYPKDDFGSSLREIARLIKARVGLEVACVDLGGWDTHFVQGSTDGFQAAKASVLGESLAAFDADIKEQRKDVTVLVMTEFGRRIYENSSLGTDHGRGFAAMVLSERIKGGRIIGKWPSVIEETEAKAGDVKIPVPVVGGMAINYDYRSVFGEVLCGSMGLDAEKLKIVFPSFKAEKVGLLA
jgi:uncharacterized protein (DUF1501 family)